jgi:predicted Zn-dependent protease
MRQLLLISIFLFSSLFGLSQSDNLSSALDRNGFSKEELMQEQKELDFQDFFIESLQQKSIENHDKAIELLDKCEKLFPNNVAMLFEKAKNHLALKQFIEAHYYCDKSLHFQPDNFWIIKLSKEIYYKEHDYKEAIKIQKQLYKMNKQEATELLRLYYITGNNKAGIELIEEIETKDLSISSLDYYKQRFNYDKDVSGFKSIEEKPTKTKSKKNSFVHLQSLLQAKSDRRDYQALLTESQKALNLYPAQAVLYLYNGQALNGLNKSQEAITILESGLDFVFDNPSLSHKFYNELIQAYTSISNTEKVMYYRNLLNK